MEDLERYETEKQLIDGDLQKYAVDESLPPSQTLEKMATEGCPQCGGKVTRHGNVLLCDSCGSKPFEQDK